MRTREDCARTDALARQEIRLGSRPAAGLIPRGCWARVYASGKEVWFVCRGDLIQAHFVHIRTARYFRQHLGSSSESLAIILQDAAEVRRLLQGASA